MKNTYVILPLLTSLTCVAAEDLKTMDAIGHSGTMLDDVGNPSTLPINLSAYQVLGMVLDIEGKPIEGVQVSLENITGKVTKEAATSKEGKFSVKDMPAGSYTIVATKDGYVFEPTKLTLAGKNPVAEIKITSQIAPVAASNAILIGKHSCKDNSVSINTPQGQQVHGFNTGFTAKGIYLRTLKFDKDNKTDIAIGELGQGKDVLIFDANKKQIGAVLTNGDNKGVHVAFGDMDADKEFEIAVTNQSADKQVNLYEATGKAIRPLKLFDKETKLNIAIGDVNGDKVEDLVVAFAESMPGDNVFIFDENGKSLGSFAVKLPTGSSTAQDERNDNRRADDTKVDIGQSSALAIATGDVDGDGKAEIIVGQIGKNQGYGVAVYDLKGMQKHAFNAFPGIANANGNKADCQPYQGYGVVIAAGDTDGDGKAEILASKAGGQKVRVFSAAGQLRQEFTGATKDTVITSLAFGANMGVDTKAKEEVVKDEELENITVVGKPEKPAVLDGNVIKGTVQVSNAVIVNVKVNPGAHLKLGPKVKFRTHRAIPAGLDLTPTFTKINITNTVHINAQVNTTQNMAVNHMPVDLSTSVVEDAPSVLEDIKVMVGDSNLKQETDTGSLSLSQGDVDYELSPVEVKQAEDSTPEGIRIADDGSVRFVTVNRHEIIALPMVQDFGQFVQGLADIMIGNLNMSMRGQLTANTKLTTKVRYSGQGDILSIKIKQKLKLGINFIDSPFLSRDKFENLVVLVFQDKHKALRQQIIYPTPADMEVLTNLDDSESNVENVKVEFGGNISFTMKGRQRKGMLSYNVTQGEPPVSGGVEFEETGDVNEDGLKDITVVYPNGERQDVLSTN